MASAAWSAAGVAIFYIHLVRSFEACCREEEYFLFFLSIFVLMSSDAEGVRKLASSTLKTPLLLWGWRESNQKLSFYSWKKGLNEGQLAKCFSLILKLLRIAWNVPKRHKYKNLSWPCLFYNESSSELCKMARNAMKKLADYPWTQTRIFFVLTARYLRSIWHSLVK